MCAEARACVCKSHGGGWTERRNERGPGGNRRARQIGIKGEQDSIDSIGGLKTVYLVSQ